MQPTCVPPACVPPACVPPACVPPTCVPPTYFLGLNSKGDYACFVFTDERMYLRSLDAYASLGWLD
jgi:hypothetical protein